jgi:hypothetical protein
MPSHIIVWHQRNLYPSIRANATVTLVSVDTASQEDVSNPTRRHNRRPLEVRV